MEQKLKIYVPQKTAAILAQDAELFEFRKKDRSVNRNAFLNTLTVRYFDHYRRETEATHASIAEVLQNFDLPQEQSGRIADVLLVHLQKDNVWDEKNDIALSLKPTRESGDLIAWIESTMLGGNSLSGWFRNMFASYASMPRDIREKIIFSDTLEQINEAIRSGCRISFSLRRDPAVIYTAEPYAVAYSHGELFNYLVCMENGRPMSFRLSRIRRVIRLSETFRFSPETVQELERIVRTGPQYAFRRPCHVTVQLTDTGEKRFESMYLHRPVYTSVHDHIYEFSCSPVQILQYFSRFGKDAVILEPASLAMEMKRFYEEGASVYD